MHGRPMLYQGYPQPYFSDNIRKHQKDMDSSEEWSVVLQNGNKVAEGLYREDLGRNVEGS